MSAASDREFANKTVLVTGATGGVGRRVCRLIVAKEGHVVLVGRDQGRLKALDRELRPDATSEPTALIADFASRDSTARCAVALKQYRPPLHGMVLICPSVPKSDEVIPADERWRHALDLCFLNPLSLMRAALDWMTADARIVIVSGIASRQVFPSLPITNVVRLAWLAEAKSLAARLGARGVRVNTLSLGGTLTEQFAAERAAADVPPEDTPENIPLGEYGDPDDAAFVAVSLLSRFANHITGQNLVFDGGLTRTY